MTDTIYEPHPITIRAMEYLYPEGALKKSRGGKNTEAIISRINYMEEAIRGGLVGRDHLIRGRSTIRNLELQLG